MVCSECGRAVLQSGRGRPRRYCSRSCQGKAYRRRRDADRLSALRSSAAAEGAAAGSTSAALVDSAIALADEQGIRALTLRALAHWRGQAREDLHTEWGSRDRLLAQLVQRLFQDHVQCTRPDHRDEEPVDVLLRLSTDEWRLYRAHPWLVEVMTTTRPMLVSAVLDASRAAIQAFTDLGSDTADAFNRYLALSAYIQGMGALLTAEHQESARTGTSYRAWWSEQFSTLERSGATARHPWLEELGDTQPAHAFDADAAFHDGLRRILRGLTA